MPLVLDAADFSILQLLLKVGVICAARIDELIFPCSSQSQEEPAHITEKEPSRGTPNRSVSLHNFYSEKQAQRNNLQQSQKEEIIGVILARWL